MEEIQPALTPEEWASMQAGVSKSGHRGAYVSANTECLSVWCGDCGDDYASTVPPQLRHATAALALHDQPFGFTWEDVDLLYRAASAVELESADCPVYAPSEVPASFRELADRIAALLPPREVPNG